MEPDDVADYARQSYWVDRYSVEDNYNWFSSVMQESVEALCNELYTVFKAREKMCGATSGDEMMMDHSVLRILHLGTGNSSLCADLYEAVRARELPFKLEQVAMDYAPNVIEKMRLKYSSEVLPDTSWVVGDVRNLEDFHAFGPFDAVIDRGTMDALEADKRNQIMWDDVESMLRGVSNLLAHAKGYGAFLQITWVVPYIRLSYTTGDAFVWGEQVRHALLGKSDIYRLFVYTVKL